MAAWSRLIRPSSSWPPVTDKSFSTDTAYIRLTVDEPGGPISREVSLGELLDSRSDNRHPDDVAARGGFLLGRRTEHGLPDAFSSRVLSRNHAKLLVDDLGRVHVQDLKSLHGTKIQPANGREFTVSTARAVQVMDGDVLILGKMLDNKSHQHQPLSVRVCLRYKDTSEDRKMSPSVFATKSDVPGILDTVAPITTSLLQSIGRRSRGYGVPEVYESEPEEAFPRNGTTKPIVACSVHDLLPSPVEREVLVEEGNEEGDERGKPSSLSRFVPQGSPPLVDQEDTSSVVSPDSECFGEHEVRSPRLGSPAEEVHQPEAQPLVTSNESHLSQVNEEHPPLAFVSKPCVAGEEDYVVCSDDDQSIEDDDQENKKLDNPVCMFIEHVGDLSGDEIDNYSDREDNLVYHIPEDNLVYHIPPFQYDFDDDSDARSRSGASFDGDEEDEENLYGSSIRGSDNDESSRGPSEDEEDDENENPDKHGESEDDDENSHIRAWRSNHMFSFDIPSVAAQSEASQVAVPDSGVVSRAVNDLLNFTNVLFPDSPDVVLDDGSVFTQDRAAVPSSQPEENAEENLAPVVATSAESDSHLPPSPPLSHKNECSVEASGHTSSAFWTPATPPSPFAEKRVELETPQPMSRKRTFAEFEAEQTKAVDIGTNATPQPVVLVPTPPSKIRRIGQTLGLIMVGATLGSIGTIAGLLQLAD